MIVALQVGRPRAWHRRLAARLVAAGHSILVLEVPSDVLPRSAAIVLAAERALLRSRCAGFAPAAAPKSDHRATDDRGNDLTLVLAGAPLAGRSCLVVAFDGISGEAAMLAALLDGRAPLVTVRTHDAVYAAGLPAIEDPLRLSRALEAVLGRLETLLVQAVAAWAEGRSTAAGASAPAASRVTAPAFLWRGFRGKLRRRLGAARGRPDHWRIEMRSATSPGLGATGMWHGARSLPDDGRRFYADPFAFELEGRRFVFFEEFPYATAKGVIGVVEVGDDLALSTPRTVLEAAVHLSYPFLIREEGEIYMLPEMSAARRLQLFRADPFPDRWVPDVVLLNDAAVSDATIVRHDDLYWVFATLSDGGGSTWDQLGLFHAPSLFGPWTAHPLNPVLIDAGAARPAGGMWHEDGCLMRVAQDCRSGYGAGLAICRVDRLDPSSYAQTVVRRIGPPHGAVGLHTWNRCGDLEMIDLRVPHPRA